LSKLVQAPLLSSYCIMRPVWPGAVQGPFFPLWLPPPCLQKSRASILPTPSDRRDGFPTSRASQDSLVSSRRTNSRTGQILHSRIHRWQWSSEFSNCAAISDPLILVRPSGTSLATSKPSQGLLAEPPRPSVLTRGTLDSFFLSVPSFHPHQDEGWHLHQPASASTVVSRKRGCGR
jgi:hypothetical protein